MKASSPVFHSRIARNTDQRKIAILCRRAVGSHDYVLRNLGDVIKKKHLFLVFSDDNALIGMSNYTPVFDNSAWLGMARTDPAWRGLGVAQFLQRSMASYAKRRGVNALRFFVLSTNRSSLRAARKGKFDVVAHLAHVSSSSNLGPGLLRLYNGNFFSKELKCTSAVVFQRISDSRYVKVMNGYISRGSALVRANRRNIAWILSHNELFAYEDGSMFILCRTDLTHGQFSLLAGGTNRCLRNVIQKSLEMKLGSLGGFLPYDKSILKSAQRLGFKRDSWAKHALLFEKKVRILPEESKFQVQRN